MVDPMDGIVMLNVRMEVAEQLSQVRIVQDGVVLMNLVISIIVESVTLSNYLNFVQKGLLWIVKAPRPSSVRIGFTQEQSVTIVEEMLEEENMQMIVNFVMDDVVQQEDVNAEHASWSTLPNSSLQLLWDSHLVQLIKEHLFSQSLHLS
jgi:hypothetical protein